MARKAQTVEVVWRPGERFAADPTAVYQRVKLIEHRDGVCSPQAFVDSARPADDELHDTLEWDDFSAAEAHRREQARKMIRNIRIIGREVDDAPVMVHCRVVTTDGVAEGYVDTARMRDDTELRAFALAEAKQYLRGARSRYGHLDELAKVWAALDEVAEEAA